MVWDFAARGQSAARLDEALDPNNFSYFRWFWDYAGGMIHGLGRALAGHRKDGLRRGHAARRRMGGKLWFTDNRETPDTLQVTYEYQGFVAT